MANVNLALFARGDVIVTDEYDELYRPLINAIHAAQERGDRKFNTCWKAQGSESRYFLQNLSTVLWETFPTLRVDCTRCNNCNNDAKGIHVTIHFS